MSAPKRILLLGSGFVAGPCVEVLCRRQENTVTIACRGLEKAQSLASKYPGVLAESVDVSNESQLEDAISRNDIVISLIPYTHHASVIKAAIKARKPVVTTSYVSQPMLDLDQQCKDAGIICLNEVGLDPGIDHFYALKMINSVHEEGGQIKSFLSYCGGLPAPEDSDNPLGYKFSWSARGVLLALMNNAKFWENGSIVEIPGKELMASAKPIYVNPAFAFVGYPNRDSTNYKERYNIPEAQTVVRGTLRYQGFPEFVKALVEIGFLNTDNQEFLSSASSETYTWNQLTSKLLNSNSSTSDDLLRIIESKITAEPALKKRILNGIRWLGVVSDSIQVKKQGTYLDTLCARLEELMQYEPGERDMVALQHTFEIINSDGSEETRTSTMLEFGIPNGESAMARTVGIPCGIATQLILDGAIQDTGVLAPMTKSIYEPIMNELLKDDIYCVEKVL
ncbi:hypothetical protein BB561_000439 [Smittium simulii]|uniref:Saccharopine dehydrogenase [NADP(+), L-glutamate-forming] n=1 Tax=Smittium simulii TaxID=133385 RepID=A0A2T9YZ60_9FUNG|nr:hypothetical protein BB561_000439 [Smittium simulii]